MHITKKQVLNITLFRELYLPGKWEVKSKSINECGKVNSRWVYQYICFFDVKHV